MTNTYGTTPNPYDDGASVPATVTTKAPVGGGIMLVGGLLALIGHFLDFISTNKVLEEAAKKAGVSVEQMREAMPDSVANESTSLWNAITGGGSEGKFRVILLVLGVVLLIVGAVIALAKNGKQGGSIGLGGAIVGLIGLILVMTGIEGLGFGDVLSYSGMGLWLILVGLVVGLVGAIMAFTAKNTVIDRR